MSSNIVKVDSLNAVQLSRRNLVKKKVSEAEEEAQRIVAEAKAIAAQTLKTAELKATQLREQAVQTGREQASSEFTEVLATVYEKRDKTLREIEPEVLKLSIKIAEKIVGRELKTDKQAVADLVSTALRNVRQQERLIVRVNPNDFLLIEELKNSLGHSGRTTFLDIEADPKITSGGCIIESDVGTVDARLETQLKILERALLRQADTDET